MASSMQLNYIKKFTGYKNYRDITNLLPTDLIVGSQNIFINDGVRLETRGGMDYLGAEGIVGNTVDPSWTVANRIHSNFDTFVNNQGIVMPFRVWYSGTTTQGDVVETWLPVYSGGQPTSVKKWYQVTANVPSVPILSQHKWYFAEWFDTTESQQWLVSTYGQPSVSAYSGGMTPIIVSSGTTLTTGNGLTWEQSGFANAPEGTNTIVINISGIATEVPLASGDFSTITITVANTAGMVTDDVAFQVFNNDDLLFQTTQVANFTPDVCQTSENQVYYMSWKNRNVYLSWAYNQASYFTNPVYSGSSGLNDAVFTGTFTDTQTDYFQVVIDGVASQNQKFTGTGSNSSYFDTTGYTGLGDNTYIMSIIANQVVTFTGGVVPAFQVGEIAKGNTSGALVRIIDLSGAGAIYVSTISGNLEIGETITGIASGVTSPTIVDLLYANEAYLFKNGLQVFGLVGQLPSGGIQLNGAVPLTVALDDGLNFIVPQIAANNVGDYYTLVISLTDTFSWSLNGVVQASFLPVLTTPTLLAEGISVNWQQSTGHNVGDNWTIEAQPTIIRGYRQFYYTGYNGNPGQIQGIARLPGQGYQTTLDSNGWSMQAQQNVMYMTDQAGGYYTMVVKFADNLQSQTYTKNKIVNEFMKKPLYPYLMSTEPNYISVVSSEKTWDVLGGQKFILPTQSKTFSDWVKYDFYNANWLNSNQNYFERKQWFVIPEQNQIFVWDDFMKYWHPPQSFGRRIASIAIIDGQICGHSYERNETYQLFTTSLNDLGIFPINTNISLSYYDYNKRFNKKTNQAIAFDGYMTGAPVINWKINLDVYGCKGGTTGVINPIYCYPPDGASLGKTGYGYHGLGNDPVNAPAHFTYGETGTELNYYLRNIVIWSNDLQQNWSITSIGELTKYDLASNTDIFNKDSPY